MSELTFRMAMTVYAMGVMCGVSIGLLMSMAWGSPTRRRNPSAAKGGNSPYTREPKRGFSAAKGYSKVFREEP